MLKTIILYLLCTQYSQASPAYTIMVDGEHLTQRRINNNLQNLHYDYMGRNEVFRVIEEFGEINSSQADTLKVISLETLNQMEISAHEEAAKQAEASRSVSIVDRETLFPRLFLIEDRQGTCYLYRVQWYEMIE